MNMNQKARTATNTKKLVDTRSFQPRRGGTKIRQGVERSGTPAQQCPGNDQPRRGGTNDQMEN